MLRAPAPLTASEFLDVILRNAFVAVPGTSPRARALQALAEETSRDLQVDVPDTRRARAVVRALPARIGGLMQSFGWNWNGFYALDRDGVLRLGPAHGPPVCAELTPSGDLVDGLPAPFTSGMCFDGLLLNQTLASAKGPDGTGAWPGYVSCDAESGLVTVAGIVAPLRAPSGVPVAVWDLDSTAALEPGDIRFVDVFFATLSRALPLERATFLPE